MRSMSHGKDGVTSSNLVGGSTRLRFATLNYAAVNAVAA